MNIAVASGKGGTGKTLVSTNLFGAAQKAGRSVTLVDCDAEEPNVKGFIHGEVSDSHTVWQNIPVINPEQCVFCGKCHEYCNYNAIVFLPHLCFIQPVDDLCHDCGACMVACEHGAITWKGKKLGKVEIIYHNRHAQIIEARAEVGVYSPVPLIKAAIGEANYTTLNIFDAPPGISCPFIATVEKADYVILVTEPTPFGLNDLKLSVATLQQLGKPFGVIVNRARLGDPGVYQFLDQHNYSLLMEIPVDRDIARIYSNGRLLVDDRPEYQQKFMDVLNMITI